MQNTETQIINILVFNNIYDIISSLTVEKEKKLETPSKYGDFKLLYFFNGKGGILPPSASGRWITLNILGSIHKILILD